MKILISLLLLALFVGCEAFQPTHSTIPVPTNPFSSMFQSVASPDQALWWPLLFSGFLAIAAGIVNSFVFGRGSKLLVIGILLACIPPIADYTLRQSALVVSLTVLLASGMLLAYVGGKWFGWKGVTKEIAPIAKNLKEKNWTPEEAAAIIETTVSQSPRNVSNINKGASS